MSLTAPGLTARRIEEDLPRGYSETPSDRKGAKGGYRTERRKRAYYRQYQLFIGRRERIVALALRYGIPTSFAKRESLVAGGLMSYAASFSDSFRRVGTLVGRILKGANPKDLPVQQPTKFELVINLKTAKRWVSRCPRRCRPAPMKCSNKKLLPFHFSDAKS